tara:strand:- start:241 stop:765 length:525 start_codon:yes stop_codon:yes gene_type:complete
VNYLLKTGDMSMKITNKQIREMIVEEMKMDEIIGYMARSARDAILGKRCAPDPITIPFADEEDADRFIKEYDKQKDAIKVNEEIPVRKGVVREKQMFLVDTIHQPEKVGKTVKICAKEPYYDGWRESSFIARLIHKHGVTDREGTPRVDGKHKYRFSQFGFAFSPMEEEHIEIV